MIKRSSPFLLLLLCLLHAPLALRAQPTLEYIAHACFVVTSPTGTRVIIDPYNGNRWVGYSFPEGIGADAALITHPHYDHDASYYLGPHIPVFRDPGKSSVGDIRITGVRGKHADPYGKEFGQINTIWVVETAGIRLAHLGDNGPLTSQNVKEMGRIDVLMLPIDGQFHILTREQIDLIIETLRPKLIVPMHYRVTELSELPASLGPIDPWLEGRERVRKLETSRLDLEPLPTQAESVVFRTSPLVKPWSPAVTAAVELAGEARGLLDSDPVAAVARLRGAVGRAPEAIQLRWGLARALSRQGEVDEAIRVLEAGLTSAGRGDWEYTMRSRALLARLFVKQGKRGDAAAQYRLVLAGSYRLDLRDEASRFLGVSR